MRSFVLSLVILLAAAPAGATIRIDAQCDGEAIRVDLQLTDYSSTPGPDWDAVVVYRRDMGSTDDPTPIAGGTFAWPLDDAEYETRQLVDEDIEANRGYLYFARAVDADGQEHWDGIPGEIPAWTSCGGDYPIGRGVLAWEIAYEYGGTTWIRAYFDPPCEGHWGQLEFCPEVEMDEFFATWLPYVGHTLEIRGRYDYWGMPTQCEWATSEIVPIEDCSGVVRSRRTSWSAIKRLYD
jgi:hypothetical protein